MNKIKIVLNEDGSVKQYTPDFKIVRGSYGNILINVVVPHVLLIDPVWGEASQDNMTGNNVKIGAVIRTATGENLVTKAYNLEYVKDYLLEGKKYRLYQRKMPKEFTMWETVSIAEQATSGSLDMIINVINWTKNELGTKIEEISASPIFKLDIYPSTYMTEEEVHEPSDFDELQSQVQDIEASLQNTQGDLYGNDDSGTGDYLKKRLLAGYKINLEEEETTTPSRLKFSLETVNANEVPITPISEMSATDVQSAIEELNRRSDSEHIDSVVGIEEGMVDNTDPHNPVILHDPKLENSISATSSDLELHKQNVSNPHAVTKAQVGLGNVDNTSDIDKPVSTLQQQAIDSAVSTHNENNSAHSDIRTQINNIVTGVTEVTNALIAKNYNVTTGNIKTKFDELTNTINTLNQEIEAQSGLGGYLNAHNFGKANPSQQELTNYALSQISNITSETQIFNGTRVKNLYDNNLWVLTNTQDTDPVVFEWANNGYDTVSTATNTSLGVVKGGNEYVSILNGLITVLKSQNADNLGGQAPSYYATVSALQTLQSTLQSQIETNTTNIATNTQNIASNTSSITNLENIKADKTEIPTTLSELGEDSTHRLVTDSEKSTWNNKLDAESDPTVPAWAKAPSKPTYDYSEIENTPNIPEGAVLYDTTGQNTDGAMTQKAVTDEINNITSNTTLITNSMGGFNAGLNSQASSGGAVGNGTFATKGGAVGDSAYCGDGFAGGYNAKTTSTLGFTIDAIQLGTGTNSTPKSLQVYDDNIYNAETHTLTVQNIESDALANKLSISDYNTIGDWTELFIGSNQKGGTTITLSESMENFNFILFGIRQTDKNNGIASAMLPSTYFKWITNDTYNRVVISTDAQYFGVRSNGWNQIYIENVCSSSNYFSVYGVGRKK